MFVFAARALPRGRVTFWVFFALNVVLCVGSNSKTALVGLLLLLLLMALFTGLRAHATLYGGVAFGLVGTGLLAAGFVTTNLGPITQSLGKDATLTGRTQLWTDVIHEIGTRPWFGFGWLGFWTGKMDGPSRYVLERNLWNPPNAHNAVLEVMINLGIVGAILFLIPYLRGLFRSIGQVRRVPNILGLFPITYFSLVLLQSITEVGVIGRDLTWTLFVVAVVLAARDRADERTPNAATVASGPAPLTLDDTIPEASLAMSLATTLDEPRATTSATREARAPRAVRSFAVRTAAAADAGSTRTLTGPIHDDIDDDEIDDIEDEDEDDDEDDEVHEVDEAEADIEAGAEAEADIDDETDDDEVDELGRVVSGDDLHPEDADHTSPAEADDDDHPDALAEDHPDPNDASGHPPDSVTTPASVPGRTRASFAVRRTSG